MYVGFTAKIISCWNKKKRDPEYKEIRSGSRHVIIKPPSGRVSDKFVFYVMGQTRPVMLMKWEFKVISKRTKFNKKK
jgi:hypothetical protein